MQRLLFLIVYFIAINILVLIYSYFIRSESPGEIILGWPYIYYREFRVDDELLHGWHLKNLMLDQLIYLIVAALLMLVINRGGRRGRRGLQSA